MTREETRKAAEVMLAFANGEKIEQYYDYDGKWSEVKSNCCDFDWFKNAYRVKPKEKFDPKTLQPFDRVLVKCLNNSEWLCNIFSHIEPHSNFCFCANDTAYKTYIPYNDETKHLVGTTDEAPEFYRYLED